MRNAEYKLYIEYSKTNVRKFTFSNRITSVWTVVLLTTITKSAPNINKFKDLLDRDLKFLANKFDCDS